MRIERSPNTLKDRADARAALERVMAAPAAKGRVCGPSCRVVCEVCASRVCRCACSADCPLAPMALTSDANHPIELGIVAVVYQMQRLKVFHTCWSCEGHERPDGSPWKTPAVWFYCDSALHARLLADAVAELQLQGRLRHRWQVCLSYSHPDEPDTTYCLGLAPEAAQSRLSELRTDARAIADGLEAMVMGNARALARFV